MSNFAIYMIGAILVTAALVYAAHLAGLATPWIVAGGLFCLGLGVTGAVRKTRRRESSGTE